MLLKLKFLSGILMVMILVVYAIIIKETIFAQTYTDEQMLQEVSSIIRLPDEEPTIATIVDVESLSGQSFFKYAKNGDKTLIYIDAKKAILYRPSEKKVIEVGEVQATD